MAKRKRRRYQPRNKCRFCRMKVAAIDYKDINTLQKLTTAQGRLFGRKRSGNCAKHQRSARVAIKRARYIALMPYIA